MKITGLICLLITFVSSCHKKDVQTSMFPLYAEKVRSFPGKNNLWVFILAGQSNMAGRGLVEPSDTIPNPRILSLDSANNWIFAKEPLHFYEPERTGLDCGVSFAKTLLGEVGDSIHIALIPCAVGGSSIQQWLGDSVHRNVKLFSNFKVKTELALQYGIIKGVLWHQGEENANPQKFVNYRKGLEELFTRFRTVAQNDSLPILAGELGAFLKKEDYSSYPDSINNILRQITQADKNVMLVTTSDLNHKGDFVHFNSTSQRILGRRLAEIYLKQKSVK